MLSFFFLSTYSGANERSRKIFRQIQDGNNLKRRKIVSRGIAFRSPRSISCQRSNGEEYASNNDWFVTNREKIPVRFGAKIVARVVQNKNAASSRRLSLCTAYQPGLEVV